MSRRAARVDSNQSAVVADLRKMGVTVAPTHTVGKGFPDIVCGYRGVSYLFEIKDSNKPPSKRRLTPDEAEWHGSWRGQVDVITSAEDAIRIMKK